MAFFPCRCPPSPPPRWWCPYSQVFLLASPLQEVPLVDCPPSGDISFVVAPLPRLIVDWICFVSPSGWTLHYYTAMFFIAYVFWCSSVCRSRRRWMYRRWISEWSLPTTTSTTLPSVRTCCFLRSSVYVDKLPRAICMPMRQKVLYYLISFRWSWLNWCFFLSIV